MGAKSFAPKKAKANPFAVKKKDSGKVNPFSKKPTHSVTATGKDHSDPTGCVITNFRQIDGVYWAAHVTYKGFTMEFHNKYSSWMADVNADFTEPVFSRDGYHGMANMKEAQPYVRDLLQEMLPAKPKPEPEPKPKKEVKNPWKQLSKKSQSEKKSSSKSDQPGQNGSKRSRSSRAAGGRKGTGRAQRTRSKG